MRIPEANMEIRNTATGPLYTQLAAAIRGRIISGSYERGAKLPSESELMADTGYSRSTVRHALKVLADEGLIATQRGRGAFVTHRTAARGEDLSFSSYTMLMEHSGGKAATRTVDACMARAAGAIAKFFDMEPGSPLVKLVRMRYLDDAPLCLETSYLTSEFSPLIDEDLDGSLYKLLQEKFHRVPGQGHKSFEVCFAKQNEAFLLDVPRDTALMLITDYVHDADGEPLHVSKRVQRTDRAKYIEPIE